MRLPISRTICHTGIRRGRRLVTQRGGVVSGRIGWVLSVIIIELYQLRRPHGVNLHLASGTWGPPCRSQDWWKNGARALSGKEISLADRGESKVVVGKPHNGDARL